MAKTVATQGEGEGQPQQEQGQHGNPQTTFPLPILARQQSGSQQAPQATGGRKGCGGPKQRHGKRGGMGARGAARRQQHEKTKTRQGMLKTGIEGAETLSLVQGVSKRG